MDQIANMLSKIMTAQAVQKETVDISFSNLKMSIAEILAKEKFVKSVEKKGKKVGKSIEIVLRYDDNGQPGIRHAARISKLSRRIYLPFNKIRLPKGNTGIVIMTTPKGILTGREARKQKVGGEILCEVW